MTDRVGVSWLSDPKNFYACLVACHLYEQQLQAKSEASVYTPQEITKFMTEKATNSYLIDELNDEVDADYDSLDEVFGRA